jgi:hypothetical protein
MQDDFRNAEIAPFTFITKQFFELWILSFFIHLCSSSFVTSTIRPRSTLKTIKSSDVKFFMCLQTKATASQSFIAKGDGNGGDGEGEGPRSTNSRYMRSVTSFIAVVSAHISMRFSSRTSPRHFITRDEISSVSSSFPFSTIKHLANVKTQSM